MPVLDLPREEWEWLEEALFKVPEEARDVHWQRSIDSVHLVVEAMRSKEVYSPRKP